MAASCMQGWALLLSGHTYRIKYRKSELHSNTDGLSRLPLPVVRGESQQADVFYFRQVEDAPITSEQVKKHTRRDPVLSKLLEVVLKGGDGNSTELKPFMSGCLLWGRVIIPPVLWKRLLQQLHVGHCGMVRMKELARSYFWWPGLDGRIEETAKTCPSCQTVRCMPQPAPLHPWTWPQASWQRIHVDFARPFEERMSLVAIDAHSKWPEVAIMKSTTAEKTIEKLGEMFARFGFTEQLVSDNSPQFISQEFERFLAANGVQHIRSAPYHPSTNGQAERIVQSLKHALKASQGEGTLHQRLNSFLLSYRTTPHATTKVAPATLLFKKQLHTGFDLLKPLTIKETVQQKQQGQVERHRQKAKERILRSGERVLARNYTNGPKWVPATVIAQTGPVSYTVRTDEDIVWRRHVDQLLRGAATSAGTMDGCAEPSPLDSPAPPTHTQAKTCAEEPAFTGPGTEVPQTELCTPPAAEATPRNTPDGAVFHRYPQRERGLLNA